MTQLIIDYSEFGGYSNEYKPNIFEILHTRETQNIIIFLNEILFSKDYRILSRENIRRKLHYFSYKANVMQIRVHDLRHSHVALLIMIGDDALTIKKD